MDMSCDKAPSPKIIKESVRHLKEWLSKEPHLPNIQDDDWLETSLHNNRFSLEKTKFKIENYYLLKNKYPDILKNRDPTSSEIELAGKALMTCISHRLTKNGYLLIYNKFGQNAEIFDFKSYVKRTFMIADMMHLEKNRLVSCISIADCQNLNYKHFLKMTPSLIAAMGDILTNAYTERVKAFHVINAPNFIQKIVDFLKRYFPERLASRIQIHSEDFNPIFKVLDQDVLSSDYGGSGPTLAELDDHCRYLLGKHRAWFIEQDNVCANESLRKERKHLPGVMEGSFKQLDID